MAKEQPRPAWGIAASTRLDDWLAIEPDGTVVAFSGKVETGTGVRTALAQIVAEELQVPLDRVRLVMGDTELTPNEGYTAGSNTIVAGGANLRKAAAEARMALLEQAAAWFGKRMEELELAGGEIVVQGEPSLRVGYGELQGGRPFQRSISEQVSLRPASEYMVVGTSANRVDLEGKFTGAPSFVHDVRLPGMLHGRVVRPHSPGARPVAVDESSIQEAEVIRVGDFIGVVAEREEQAIKAVAQLRVTWQETTALPPMDELFDWMERQPTTDIVINEAGDVSESLRGAAKRVHAVYRQPFQAHASLGPSCAVAELKEGLLTIWCSSGGVYPLRGALADLLQMSPEQIRVIHREGAGAYGQNGSEDVAADAALLARACGRPVRVQWSRADEFVGEPKAAAMVMEAQGGLDEQGGIQAWDFQVWSPSHTNRPRQALGFLAGRELAGHPEEPRRQFFFGGDRNAPNDYVFDNRRVTMHWVDQPPLRTSSMRSLGGAGNTFANESFMDELAAAAEADPLAFRRRHLSDPRALAVLNAVAEASGWESGESLPAGTGRGLAFARYENELAYVAMVAEVAVDDSTGAVQVRRLTIAHDCGLIINPDGVRNQVEGNVLQALSRALKEEVRFDAHGQTSLDWESYPILTFSEVPELDIVLIDRPDKPSVGAGEPATVVVAPAVANAIYAATGARIRQVPFTPARIREALVSR